MASVWYVGESNQRIMSPADWDEAGVDASDATEWSWDNGWSVSEDALTAQQIGWLEGFPEEFLVHAPNGPRMVLLLPPDTFVTLNQLRAMLYNFTFPPGIGLTPASVGLALVDNVPDLLKPLSAAAIAALKNKADYPSGGTDGQVLVKSGTTTAWASGGSGGNTATGVADPRMPSGQSYTFSSGGTAVANSALPSGTGYNF